MMPAVVTDALIQLFCWDESITSEYMEELINRAAPLYHILAMRIYRKLFKKRGNYYG